MTEPYYSPNKIKSLPAFIRYKALVDTAFLARRVHPPAAPVGYPKPEPISPEEAKREFGRILESVKEHRDIKQAIRSQEDFIIGLDPGNPSMESAREFLRTQWNFLTLTASEGQTLIGYTFPQRVSHVNNVTAAFTSIMDEIIPSDTDSREINHLTGMLHDVGAPLQPVLFFNNEIDAVRDLKSAIRDRLEENGVKPQIINDDILTNIALDIHYRDNFKFIEGDPRELLHPLSLQFFNPDKLKYGSLELTDEQLKNAHAKALVGLKEQHANFTTEFTESPSAVALRTAAFHHAKANRKSGRGYPVHMNNLTHDRSSETIYRDYENYIFPDLALPIIDKVESSLTAQIHPKRTNGHMAANLELALLELVHANKKDGFSISLPLLKLLYENGSLHRAFRTTFKLDSPSTLLSSMKPEIDRTSIKMIDEAVADRMKTSDKTVCQSLRESLKGVQSADINELLGRPGGWAHVAPQCTPHEAESVQALKQSHLI